MDYAQLLTWFSSSGGEVAQKSDASGPVWTLQDFSSEGMGTGLVATTDLEENALLFRLPRGLVLSTRTSQLPQLLERGDESATEGPRWSSVAGKWTGLMLCMLWERARSLTGLALGGADPAAPQWGPYLATMPTEFDTPMFWSPEELAWLQGTSIQDKIGRAEADEEYTSLVLPLVRARPALFLPGWSATSDAAALDKAVEEYYSLALYHIMGSRILSRSFHVEERADDEEEEDEEGEEEGDASRVSGKEDASMREADESHMSLDKEPAASAEHEDGDEDEDEEEEEEKESVEDIGMVCLADLLNARPGLDHNARLFYRTEQLEMRTTRPVKQGEQLFNTYADPPNSDLLRRYGYVDTHHPSSPDPLDNPNDNVELGWGCVIEAAVAEAAAQGAAEEETAALPQTLRERFAQFENAGLIPDESVALAYVPPDATRAHLEAGTGEEEQEEEQETGVPELLMGCKLAWCDAAAADKYLARDQAPESKWSGTLAHKASGRSVPAGQLALRAVERRQALYPATLADDEAALQALQAPERQLSPSERRQAAALTVRIGEQRILARLHALLAAALAKYAAAKARADANAQKDVRPGGKRGAAAAKGSDKKRART